MCYAASKTGLDDQGGGRHVYLAGSSHASLPAHLACSHAARSNYGYGLITTGFPHSGYFGVEECGYDSCSGYVQQQIAVPSGAALSYWLFMASADSMSAYAGRSVILRFSATTNASYPTYFALDDVAVR